MSKHRKTKIKVCREAAGEPVTLYWAYGSNLCHKQMMRRCPRARPLAPLSLSDGVLTFRGYADVESREGGVIAGGLWKITPDCEKALDLYEGVGRKIYERRFLLLEVDGVKRRCLYYRMLPDKDGKRGVMPPWDSYLRTIEQGYRDFGLDMQLLDEALARAWGEKNKTAEVVERWKKSNKPKLARRTPPRKKHKRHYYKCSGHHNSSAQFRGANNDY